MNKKLKITLFVVILVIIVSGLYLISNYSNKNITQNKSVPPTVFDPLNTTYNVENELVTLINGKSENSVKTLIFGKPVLGDLNGDGINDAAVIITQDTGGSGLFYYVAAAISDTKGAHGTNAIFLGDRIAPQNIEIKNQQIIANYADRKSGEPMTKTPSEGVSAYLIFDGTVLKKIIEPTQIITYLSSKEETTKYCNGVDMDSLGYQKTIINKESTSTPELNPTKLQIIKTVLNAATTGMCHDVLSQLDIKENNGIVSIPTIEGWAGVSITMCSCKPQVEVNLLQIPGITKVVW